MSIPSPIFKLLEDDFMKNVILITFTGSTVVAADMYCDVNTKTGGGI